MDSEAFNSFCITCDQLCSESSVYCSDECRVKDEHKLSSILQSCTADIASPLLTPSFYQQAPLAEVHSPLLLPASYNDESANVRDFSLNYSLSVPLSQGRAIASTSQNYRLWLSGVM